MSLYFTNKPLKHSYLNVGMKAYRIIFMSEIVIFFC